MTRLQKAAGWAAIAVSGAAFVVAVFGGVMASAFNLLLGLFGASGDQGPGSYPLGGFVFAVYVLGAVAGAYSTRWPGPTGAAMVLLAVVAYAFGGPVAKAFGILMLGVGAIVALSSLSRSRR